MAEEYAECMVQTGACAIITDREKVIAAAGGLGKIRGQSISERLERILEQGRILRRFTLRHLYGGVVNNRWKPTRIEYACGDTGWYLVGIPTSSLTGLRVRMS